MIHGCAIRQFIFQAGEIRRSFPGPGCVDHIITQKADGKNPSVFFTWNSRRSVQGQHMKGDRITWLHGPAQNGKFTSVCFNIRGFRH